MNTWDFLRNTQSAKDPHGRYTITAETAQEIRRLLKDGVPRKGILDELKHRNVKAHHIADIACGKSWKGV